jgi:FkbM family methyltransferase
MSLAGVYRLFGKLPGGRARGWLSRRYKAGLERQNHARVVHGLVMDLDPWEWIQNELRRRGQIEPETVRLYGHILRSGDVYVDIGAHVGFQTLVARHHIGTSGKVIAVEPQPYNCAKVLTNWRINGFDNVTVYPAAAGDENDFVTLCDQPTRDRSRLSIVAPSIPGDERQRFRVPLMRLDKILGDERIVRTALVKIDTEGQEWPVVRSAGDAIGAIDNLLIEVWDPSRPEYRALAAHLKGQGFALRNVRGETWDEVSPLPELNLWAARVS